MTTEQRGGQPQFRLNIKETPSVIDTEQREALDWYVEKVNNLPGMRVEEFPVTGEGGWEARISPDGKVQSIEGRHFSIKGRKVIAPTFGWNQPMVIQRSEEYIDTEGKRGRVSGMVLLLIDPNDNIFVSVSEEPGIAPQTVVEKEVHPIVRTPFQTSVEKLQQLSAGIENVDKTLFAVLNTLKGNRDLPSLIGEISWRPVDTDGNRIESHVLYGVLRLNQEASKLVSERNPSGKFLSRHQLKVLPLNGHLHIALSATS